MSIFLARFYNKCRFVKFLLKKNNKIKKLTEILQHFYSSKSKALYHDDFSKTTKMLFNAIVVKNVLKLNKISIKTKNKQVISKMFLLKPRGKNNEITTLVKCDLRKSHNNIRPSCCLFDHV